MRAARTSVVWLVDGHNVLLNVPDMERAHARDALAARTALAERCERFGMRRRILVVASADARTWKSSMRREREKPTPASCRGRSGRCGRGSRSRW
jgi:predicted RNA-binding protein with PIN domain